MIGGLEVSKTFCSLPWMHLATHPHGRVTPCCVSDHVGGQNRARNYVNGTWKHLTLNKDSINDVMNSDYFKEIRLQLLDDKIPHACRRCFQEEAAGVRSKRIEENYKHGYTEERARSITKDDGEIDVQFKFIELRLGNICNLRCRTCNPVSSSNWVIEYSKLQSELKFVTQYDKDILDVSWTESDAFWEDLLDHSTELELIYINGGEPTLAEKHWGYLQRLIDRGLNKQVTLWYNINVTNLPDKLLEIWKQFKNVQVTCSIDDLLERNEYIRTGTKWDVVMRNLDKLQAQTWLSPTVCQTISWMNIYYIKEFYDFMNSRGLHVHLNTVHDPMFLSPNILPLNAKKAVQDKNAGMGNWAWVQKILDEPYNEELFSKGIIYNKWLDTSRKTEFKTVFPEWFTILAPYYENYRI